MATELSREKAAQAWCTPTTSNKLMDTDLAEAFANILDDIWSKPWRRQTGGHSGRIGNATTRELIEELKARIDLDYRTVD